MEGYSCLCSAKHREEREMSAPEKRPKQYTKSIQSVSETNATIKSYSTLEEVLYRIFWFSLLERDLFHTHQNHSENPIITN